MSHNLEMIDLAIERTEAANWSALTRLLVFPLNEPLTLKANGCVKILSSLVTAFWKAYHYRRAMFAARKTVLKINS